MSRSISPLKDDRSTKRARKSLNPAEMLPENIADIVDDGDAVLVLSGMSSAPKTPIGLRVSSHALSMASAVFKAEFAAKAVASTLEDGNSSAQTVLEVEDDGDAMYILCNILHLRNNKLPVRMLPELLYKLSALAVKYQCVDATGRATLQWFDRLHASTEQFDTWKIIEAAHNLDEPMFFARFTNRWMLKQSLFKWLMPSATSGEAFKLAMSLMDRYMQCVAMLRNELDNLADCCLFAFSDEYKHNIGWETELSPASNDEERETPHVKCWVDYQGAEEYITALRKAGIWPSTKCARPTSAEGTGDTIGSVVEKLEKFDVDYNDDDICDYCEGVKGIFEAQLELTKKLQNERLWGLCLDCYKAGGLNRADCRYEHPKLI